MRNGKKFVFGRYGLAPTLIFRNPELSLGAKSVYGYLSTFVSTKQIKKGVFKAWPSRRRMLKDLAISPNTLTRYLNELKEKGLIKVKQSRQVKDGKEFYGNNFYILQPYLDYKDKPEANEADQSEHVKLSNSNSDQLNSCATQKVNTSNTRSIANTKHTSNTDLSANYWQEVSKSSSPSSLLLEERENLKLEDLIDYWNKQGVNVHKRLGSKTKKRIAKAWASALEDYSEPELLGAINNYSKLYKRKKCHHKYSLAIFLERGYEHFLHLENWNRGEPMGKITREDFTYSDSIQDRSQFWFLNDN